MRVTAEIQELKRL